QTFYQYEEGIYVGYRYYETADAVGYFDSDAFAAIPFKNGAVKGYDQVVQFPFGYGLSYTTFTEEITASDITLAPHGTNSVTVKVTNTGSVAGKNVVELYMDAPYQTDTDRFGIKGVGLEKAKVVLIGFDKTGVLQPGESQEVTITFATDDLASFDNFGQGCWVLENGTYTFNVQKDAHQWGERASASVTAELSDAVIYNESGAGARSSDKAVAVNAMDDVTAGDGCMLEGYLSRSDIAGGMAAIMQHTSNEAPNENASEGVKEVLLASDDETVEYTFTTFRNGEKTEITETLYAHGNNAMPFMEVTPDGVEIAGLAEPLWEQTCYVVEGKTTEAGNPVVVDEKPAEPSHVLTVADLAGVDIYTGEGAALFEKLANMTTMDEAIEIQGNSGWNVSAIPSVGKPAQKAQDGPGEPANGTFAGATWFPCAVSIAATWNRDLAYAEGLAYGHQAILAGVGCAYAPAMNTHRSPFGGRNFEYYSEDGFIAGQIGGNAVKGIQATGTNVFIKHLALNDGDTNRGGNTTWANEQAIREIYMVPYEISIKQYGANGVMGSLNRIGMSWFHYGMYQVMIRNEWGWKGLLITDGDGGAGDCYNTPVAMLSVEGSMLSRSLYANARSTVQAYGDPTETLWGRISLHNIIRDCLYQYASTLNNAD
ncbi:MAG: fibronectin type III-like domain-contianing protein, partial [Clostridia bacterium]|nr:fibronectin type III-like domain-contianing protein [Clostridia bacterium]